MTKKAKFKSYKATFLGQFERQVTLQNKRFLEFRTNFGEARVELIAMFDDRELSSMMTFESLPLSGGQSFESADTSAGVIALLLHIFDGRPERHLGPVESPDKKRRKEEVKMYHLLTNKSISY